MGLKLLNGCVIGLLLFCCLGADKLLVAQQQNTSNVQPPPEKTEAVGSPALHVQMQDRSQSEMRLGDYLTLHVQNLAEWTKAGNSPWNLILFLNNRPMKGIHPSDVNEQAEYVEFRLERKGENDETWDQLMERGKNWDWCKVSRILQASTGLDNGYAVASEAQFRMVFLSRFAFLLIAVIIGGSFCVLLFVGRKTPLLKDDPAGPYSLARTQMALWSWLTIDAYLYLYVLSQDPAVDIPASILGLMGISATTYVAAAMVDRSMDPASGKAAPEPSKGFFQDIFGGKQLSLHRLQMIGWTVALAFVFVIQVVRTLSIPDFNPTLLGLMGLSAGTYVGFKIPEKQSQKPDQGAKAEGAAAGG